uniref:Putative ovule protein n=1 Tax=Solanum chacoense TaxID=4108 RepID=A0A0V0H803_SOLCH
MPKEWRWSTMVQLYKNKGDIQNHNNYRCIKLLSHIRKVWERVMQMRVKRVCPFSRTSSISCWGNQLQKSFIL